MEHIINLITNYKYLILFPLAVVEGPVLAVLSGFLCSNGLINPFLVYPILVMGDITGDSIFYSIGRWSIPFLANRVIRNDKCENDKIKLLKVYIHTNPGKIIPLSKITLGIGFTGILLAGISRLRFRKFIILCLLTSALQYLIYLSVGLLVGAAYVKINQYINRFVAFTIGIGLTVFCLFFIRFIRNKIYK